MKRLVLGLVLWSMTAPAWAASVYDLGSEWSDRDKRRAGGMPYELEQVNARASKIVITALSGRSELEDIQLYSQDGYKADLPTLVSEDSRNADIYKTRSRFSADGYNSQPQSLTLYLPYEMLIDNLEIGVEAWSDNAMFRVELVADSVRPLPNPYDPREPSRPVDPDPVYPPAPTCDPVAITDRILQCSTDKLNVREDNLNLESSLNSLRDQVAERNARINQCNNNRASLESKLVALESNLDRTATEIRRMVGENKRMRRRTHRLENPVQKWDCFVQARSGQRWTEQGTNRVQMLQKMLRQCGEGKANCGGGKWKANEKGRWGCRPVPGSQKDKKFDEDQEDDNDMPGEREGKRKKRDRGDRDGRRRNG